MANPFDEFDEDKPNPFDEFDATPAQDPLGTEDFIGGEAEPVRAPGQTWGEYGAGTARAAGQGLSFGFSDEAEAWVRSTFGEETYVQNRDKIRAAVAKFAETNPGTAIPAELIGAMIIPGMGAAKVAGSGAGMVAKGLGYGAIGGSQSALTGAGLSEADNVPDVLKDAGSAALVGGPASAVLGPVAEKAIPAIGKGLNYMRPKLAGGKANQTIRKAMQVGEGRNVMDEFNELGPRAMPLNATRKASSRATSASTEGADPDLIEEAFMAQRAGVADDVLESIGGGQGNRMIDHAIDERAAQDAIDEAYEVARALPTKIDLRGGKVGDSYAELGTIINKSGKPALQQSAAAILKKHNFAEGPMTVRKADQLIKSLEDARPKPTKKNAHRIWTQMTRSVRDRVYADVPEYAEAATLHAKKMARQDASEFAETLFGNTKPVAIQAKIREGGPEYAAELKRLAPEILRDRIEATSNDGVALLKPMAMQKKLGMLFDPDDAKEIAKSYGRLRRFSTDAGKVSSGSMTAEKTAGGKQLAKNIWSKISGATLPAIGGGIVGGPMGAAAMGGAKMGADALSGRATNKAADALIKKLMTTGPAAQKVMRKATGPRVSERPWVKGQAMGGLLQLKDDEDPWDIEELMRGAN